jgi:hypothetical protein
MKHRKLLFKKARRDHASRRRIMFMTPALYLLDGDTSDFEAPISALVFDLIAKAAADAQEGTLTPDGEARAHAAREALARAADAMCQGKPVPADLRWAAWQVREDLQRK